MYFIVDEFFIFYFLIKMGKKKGKKFLIFFGGEGVIINWGAVSDTFSGNSTSGSKNGSSFVFSWNVSVCL